MGAPMRLTLPIRVEPPAPADALVPAPVLLLPMMPLIPKRLPGRAVVFGAAAPGAAPRAAAMPEAERGVILRSTPLPSGLARIWTVTSRTAAAGPPPSEEVRRC